MNAIYERRSIRKYKGDQVSNEDILQLIKAASASPSAKNRQPWKYIVCTGESKKAILKAMEEGIEREKKGDALLPNSASGLADAVNTMRIMAKAPVLIMVYNTLGSSPYEPVNNDERVAEICNTLSIGASIENMLLQAQELGLGTLWVANTCYAYPELIKTVGDEGQLIGCIVVGVADEQPPARPRKNIEAIVEFRN